MNMIDDVLNSLTAIQKDIKSQAEWIERENGRLDFVAVDTFANLLEDMILEIKQRLFQIDRQRQLIEEAAKKLARCARYSEIIQEAAEAIKLPLEETLTIVDDEQKQ